MTTGQCIWDMSTSMSATPSARRNGTRRCWGCTPTTTGPGWAAFMSADLDQSHEVALMQLGDDAPVPAEAARSDSTIWRGGSRASTI